MEKMAIEVKTQFEGLHCWPDAPDEVKFLRHTHRHMFHVVLRLPVHHNDRELEFIMVKHELEKFLKERYSWPDAPAALGRMSCEDIAKSILKWVMVKYSGGCVRTLRGNVTVGVFEDGENGCWLEDVDVGGY